MILFKKNKFHLRNYLNRKSRLISSSFSVKIYFKYIFKHVPSCNPYLIKRKGINNYRNKINKSVHNYLIIWVISKKFNRCEFIFQSGDLGRSCVVIKLLLWKVDKYILEIKFLLRMVHIGINDLGIPNFSVFACASVLLHHSWPGFYNIQKLKRD